MARPILQSVVLPCAVMLSGITLSYVMLSFVILSFVILSYIVELVVTIEIGLQHAPFVALVYFFPHLNMQKNLLIMGPNNTKNSSLSVIFSFLTMNNNVRILFLL